MDRLRLMGAVSALGMLFALAISCGKSFSSADAGSESGSGGVSSGGNFGQGGSRNIGGSSDSGGSVDPGTGGDTGMGGEAGVAGEVGMAGGSGAGGEAGMTGNAGNAGTGGSGTTDGGVPCTFGSIKFQMRPGANVAPGYFCTETCIPWVKVFSHETDHWLTISQDCTINDCESCMLPACLDIACLSQAVPENGVEMTWDGSNFAGSRCNSALGVDVICQEPVCLPQGQYEARVCAYVNEAGTPETCQTGANQVCKDVNFDFEGGEVTVTAELEP